MRRLKQGFFVSLFAALLSSCMTVSCPPSPVVAADRAWLVVPFANHTTTPMAGNSVAALIAGLLRARGVPQAAFRAELAGQRALPGIQSGKADSALLRYAQRHHYRYLITGDVVEWRYKVGIDGEPTVGIVLKVWDAHEHTLIWSAVASKVGYSRQSVSYLAQCLLRKTLANLRLEHEQH